MDFAYYLHGSGTPLIKRYQVNETLATAGIPVLAPGEGNAGVQISTTTSWANAVGVTLDTATYVTAQQTDGTSTTREVTVIISPHSVFRPTVLPPALSRRGQSQHVGTLHSGRIFHTPGGHLLTPDASR